MQGDVDQGFSFDLDAFRAAYARFLAPAGGAAPRVLLTGHSHQAWPDVARDALVACFDDAARLVDDKWDAAVLPKLAAVGEAILERMGFDRGDAIAFGQNTHELVYRLITALPRRGPLRIVTTQGEFHSLRRQLARLAEEGVEVEWVSVEPRAALADRLLAALRPGTSMLAISAVLFESATVVPRLDEIVARAAEIGAVPLVDAYHAFNVVPIAWGRAAPHVFAVAGGYKYAAMGEGICWMRVPPACALRPVFTGWFADFGALAGGGGVAYAPGGARFAGSTFDPSALYRAAAALEHWDRFGLTVPRLRAISLRQTGRILDLLDAAGRGGDVISPREPERRGGFVAVRCARAGDVVERLRARRVLVDARREALRIGPAPYLTDAEIDEGVAAVLEELGR
ncbi:aminotransferase class V-fold PLP-dependent enzyme [Sorangium sp. So ce315]|uniref:aminotransferase class V-fold PLP-dependent enzyme n=1 Tax=Sorangium sp. So ce315 TaxID=3133299 RepID=UPI003F5DCA60